MAVADRAHTHSPRKVSLTTLARGAKALRKGHRLNFWEWEASSGVEMFPIETIYPAERIDPAWFT